MAIDYKNSLGRYRRYLSNLQSQPLWNASFWVSLTIILVLVMVVFFLRPTVITISGLLGKKREQEVLLVRIDNKINLLKEAQTNYYQTSDGQKVLAKVLPDESLWRELADSLYQIATNSGVTINKVEVGNVLIKGNKIEVSSGSNTPENALNILPTGVEKVVFRLDLKGEYSQIKECLFKIETAGRMLLINNARISKSIDGTLSLNLEGYATFFKYQKEQK